MDRFILTRSLLFSSLSIHGKAYAKYLVKTFGPEQEKNAIFTLESIHFMHLLTHKRSLSSHSVVPSLWDPVPEDLRWSWCNNNRNKARNKYNALESPPNHSPFPQSLEKFSSMKLIPDAENVGDNCIRWWALCWMWSDVVSNIRNLTVKRGEYGKANRHNSILISDAENTFKYLNTMVL